MIRVGKLLGSLLLGTTLTLTGLQAGALGSLHLIKAAPANGFANALVGNWHNENGPATRSITRLQFFYGGKGQLYVHAYGKCHPVDCDWGSTLVTFPVARPARAVFTFRFAAKTMNIIKEALTVTTDTFTHFTDGSGRQDYHSIDSFLRDR